MGLAEQKHGSGGSQLFKLRKKALRAVPDLSGKSFLFIAGLHRSGTSILHRQLGEHPDVGAFHDTGVKEDEGQHLQDVLRTGEAFGGPGRFAFHPEAQLTQDDAARLAPHDRDRLFRQWGAHWDLSRPVLIEKSPPTLVRARFFQALFPNSRFVFIVRHPIAVALATQKWAMTPVAELIAHWAVAHARLLEDLPHLEQALVVRYEDYVRDAGAVLGQVQAMLGLEARAAHEATSDRNHAYFERWGSLGAEQHVIRRALGSDGGLVERFGYGWEPPFFGDWAGLSKG